MISLEDLLNGGTTEEKTGKEGTTNSGVAVTADSGVGRPEAREGVEEEDTGGADKGRSSKSSDQAGEEGRTEGMG